MCVFLLKENEKKLASAQLDNQHSVERAAQEDFTDFGYSKRGNTRNMNVCLPYIFYDKPVKTSSSAVTRALVLHLQSTGEEVMDCWNKDTCHHAAEEVCMGKRPPAHMVYHVMANASLVQCLHSMGYYHVTSIREPKERILSAYKFNKVTPNRHNGVDPDATFDQFLEQYPRCALYKYYDGLSASCGSDKEMLIQRAANIANRMDEIIELSEKPTSHVYGKISQYLTVVNAVSRTASNATNVEVPDEFAEPEYVLYNKLRERRALLARQPERILCDSARLITGF